MNCIKKMISDNRKATCIAMAMAGLALGLIASKMVLERCCCTNQLKKKAKKAFKAVEDKMM